jgi:hypothetical protein
LAVGKSLEEMMRRIFVGLILVVLLGALVACGKSTALTPEETAQAFLKAMENRLFLEAYPLLSADSQATIGKAEDFKAMMDNAWASAGITGFQVGTVQKAILSSSGTRASVPYSATLTSQDGGASPSTPVFNALSLVQEGGQWFVIWPPIR